MDRMQNEAMDRLRQMYSKTTKPVSEEKAQNSVATPTKNEPLQKPIEDKNIKSSKSLLDVFMQDKEKSLILLLIVILISEKADSTIVLALMYLIL